MKYNWICECDTIVIHGRPCSGCGKRRYGIDGAYMYQGLIRPLNEWARCRKIPYQTLYRRLKRGWSFSRAITKKYEHNKKNKKMVGKRP